MKQEIKNLLYNPSSVHTCDELPQGIDFNNHDGSGDHLMLSLFESLVLETNPRTALTQLSQFHSLLNPKIAQRMRLTLLNEFNTLMENWVNRFCCESHLYETSLKTIIKFKQIIDHGVCEQNVIHKEEWISLEKSLYILSEWEGRLPLTADSSAVFS